MASDQSMLFALNTEISIKHSNNKNYSDTLLLERDYFKELWWKSPHDIDLSRVIKGLGFPSLTFALSRVLRFISCITIDSSVRQL